MDFYMDAPTEHRAQYRTFYWRQTQVIRRLRPFRSSRSFTLLPSVNLLGTLDMAFDASENVFDPTVEFNRREYFTSHVPILEVPDSFIHTPPSDQPTPPAYPSDPDEAAEVVAYREYGTTPTLAGAITWVADYTTYWNANMAWKHANDLARKTQYRIAYGDALIFNRSTTPASGDETGGGGSDPPPPAVWPRNDP